MVKPISLNKAYRGRRFTTPELASFKELIYYSLPNSKIDYKGKKIKAIYIFGTSSKNADGDNLIKCFQDVISDKYQFNDKQIYKWEVEKVDVPKGFEYCSFELEVI